MATSMGFTQNEAGDLYELFSDGTKKLVEAGYVARVMREAKAANEKLYGSGGNQTTTVKAATVSATPSTASSAVSVPPVKPVKTATKDIILFDEQAVAPEIMESLVFEAIGGQELINIARRDTVNGQKVSYQPIVNLTSIEQQYNPNNLLSLQATSDKFFSNFSIKLENKIPAELNGSNVYLDQKTGNIIIEVANLAKDEQIEVQIITDGTIYEADI